MTDKGPVLRCDGVSFRYQASDAPTFDGLSFAVEKGEAILLMGPSGCGKSTLAFCLAGLYPDYAGQLSGHIAVSGDALSALTPDLRARKVSILFQNPDNQFCMDRVDREILFALENINYPGDMAARAKELLGLVGLAHLARAPLHTLSGGTKQKVALATALATEAELLILDEPFANIDPAACTELAALLRGLNEAGLTLFIVDHRMTYWRPFLSRVLLMDAEGRLDGRGILPAQIAASRAAFAERGLFFDDGWLDAQPPPPPPVPGDFIVQAEGLCLAYGKKTVLAPTTLALEKGSITALVGANGSGKSTLLSALAGVGPYKGRLRRQGKTGMVFQNPRYQFLTLKVWDEVETTLRASFPALTQGELTQRGEALLAEFALTPYRDASPYTLSQGQQRRLALLSMLAGEQDLLLLDEPTYAQDQRATRFIVALLRRRVAAGLTAVIATHDLALAQAVAHRILLLEDGALRELSPSQLRARAQEGRASA